MALSYYQRLPTKPLVYSNSWDVFEQNCDNSPYQEAVIIYQDDICIYRATFKELRDNTKANAAILVHTFPELKFGDRIGIVGSNRPEVFLTELMTYRLGFTAVFPPAGLKGGEDLISALKITGCRGLVFGTDYISKDEISNILDSLPSIRFGISFGADDFEVLEKNIYSWDALFDCKVETEQDAVRAEKYSADIQPDTEACVYFTSGSSGHPKAVVHSHFNLINNQLICGEIRKFDNKTRFLQDRPVSVLAGAFFSTRMASFCGSTCIIINTSKTVNKPDTSTICNIIEKEQVNEMLLFGYMVHDFINSPPSIRKQLSSLKSAVFSGQVLSMEQVGLLNEFLKVPVYNLYGSTEMNASITEDETTSFGFIGRPIHHVEAKIIGENGETVPCGTPGELCFRSPMSFRGYLTPGGLKTGKDTSGWYHTDDSAIMNDKGEVKTLGRISDAIKRAGELIYPILVEQIIVEHPQVAGVQVVGVSDMRLYQDICACVVPTDSTLKEDQLRSWCKNKFKAGRYEKSQEPTHYIFMKEFPRLASNKINRKELKALAENIVNGNRN